MFLSYKRASIPLHAVVMSSKFVSFKCDMKSPTKHSQALYDRGAVPSRESLFPVPT